MVDQLDEVTLVDGRSPLVAGSLLLSGGGKQKLAPSPSLAVRPARGRI